MNQLGNGLGSGHIHEDALSVREAELAMQQRLDAPEEHILVVQNNLASTYAALGHREKALSIEQDVYSGRLKLVGEEHPKTLLAANNYADSLCNLQRFEEGKALLRRLMPVARRVLGESHERTLRMRWLYAAALCNDPGAPLDDLYDDLGEAVTTFEEIERTARRVLGGAHPTTRGIEQALQQARDALRTRA